MAMGRTPTFRAPQRKGLAALQACPLPRRLTTKVSCCRSASTLSGKPEGPGAEAAGKLRKALVSCNRVQALDAGHGLRVFLAKAFGQQSSTSFVVKAFSGQAGGKLLLLGRGAGTSARGKRWLPAVPELTPLSAFPALQAVQCVGCSSLGMFAAAAQEHQAPPGVA